MQRLTKTKLQEILQTALALRNAQFKLEAAGGRWSGAIVSDSFRGKADSARQKLIWDALDAALGADSVKQVGMLLAYSPEEWLLNTEPATKTARIA